MCLQEAATKELLQYSKSLSSYFYNYNMFLVKHFLS